VARWAQFVAYLEERAAPLAAVLVVAGDSDPVAAAVHAESQRNRLGGAASIVSRLAAIGGLRLDLTNERAVAATLVLMDPAVHRTLMAQARLDAPTTPTGSERTAMAELLRDTPKQA
jgi:hypothetical protein